ncbi:alpha/beta fold hydrolase [Agromyces sp. ISL-38]|uniref:alpha/beta fold hydrolase n=1 Tax=Agromyces sp. ISL-38 TaxID=2819107 RepID=UPI001BED1B86|nr:alpha/beta fold hydrolase [Agromyces sp. ISL-38]MBT2498427.1 alpha/beta fold hydrolase [Agromyces sp. ISL-38]
MTLAHDVTGDGPAVLLLHSSVCDRRMWDLQWELLVDAGFRVIRPDFRGFGETPAPTSGYDEASDIRDLLDAHGIERAVVVGSSFGGRSAQEFASRWPSRVTGLFLLCAATRLLAPTEEVRAFGSEEDALLDNGDLDGAVALNVRTWVGPAATESTRELVARMQRHAFEVQLAAPDVAAERDEFDLDAVTAPTLVVSGAHDLDYFAQIAELLSERIAGAEHRELDWAGHLPSLEDPARFNPLLLHFLRSTTSV